MKGSLLKMIKNFFNNGMNDSDNTIKLRLMISLIITVTIMFKTINLFLIKNVIFDFLFSTTELIIIGTLIFTLITITKGFIHHIIEKTK